MECDHTGCSETAAIRCGACERPLCDTHDESHDCETAADGGDSRVRRWGSKPARDTRSESTTDPEAAGTERQRRGRRFEQTWVNRVFNYVEIWVPTALFGLAVVYYYLRPVVDPSLPRVETVAKEFLGGVVDLLFAALELLLIPLQPLAWMTSEFIAPISSFPLKAALYGLFYVIPFLLYFLLLFVITLYSLYYFIEVFSDWKSRVGLSFKK